MVSLFFWILKILNFCHFGKESIIFSSFINHLMVLANLLLLSTQVSFSSSPLFVDAQATSVNLLLLIQEKALILQTTGCYSWNYDNLVLATNQWTFQMQLKQQNSLTAKPW